MAYAAPTHSADLPLPASVRARHGCRDELEQVLYMAYYDTGTGVNADYLVWWDVFLPLVMRNAP